MTKNLTDIISAFDNIKAGKQIGHQYVSIFFKDVIFSNLLLVWQAEDQQQ